MTLDLGDKEPRFENVCALCKTPCRDDEFTMLRSEKYNSQSYVYVPGEFFRVPAHKHSKKCALKLGIHWFISSYGSFTFIVLSLVATIAVSAFLGLWQKKVAWLILGGWGLAALFSFIAQVLYGFTFPPIAIEQRGYNSRRFRFTFNNDQYAASFKRLNAEFLEDE